MKIKKYIAPSMPEAMKKVRLELGNNAVILHSKVVYTGGFLGIFKKRNIEVLAALENETEETMPANAIKQLAAISLVDNEKLMMDSLEQKNRKTEAVTLPSEPLKIKETSLISSNNRSSGGNSLSLPTPIIQVLEMLRQQEIDNMIEDRIVQDLLKNWYAGGAHFDYKDVKEWVKEFLLLELEAFDYGELTKKKCINVIGPTGVGKTTTLAKIAATLILQHQKKIGFITTDTYRIGAVEQLKTYASILDVPVEVCYSMEDFEKASTKLSTCDHILIDTAGRNFRDKQYVEELTKLVDYKQEMETLLVLAITAKQADLEKIYEQFSSIKIDHFIFTKMDETSSFGAMLNLMCKYKLGAAYITTGQNVPDDMIKATPHEIVKLIIEGK